MTASAIPSSLPELQTKTELIQELSVAVRNIPDYPKPGILFKDITTVIGDARLFKATLDLMTEQLKHLAPVIVVGIEARGFIFGAPLAERLNAGFVPIRKKGKLPGKTISYNYALEYGVDTIQIHEGAIPSGARVLIVDDLLATGGTAAAAAELVQQAGGVVVGYGFMIELDFLEGRKMLPSNIPVESLLHY
ncbi:MAG: adenine phosphoribosyltransferase [Vampirovibrio sp.]|jgi:adenine phosphoribosyltransferase|nr:adenine phosphoribosyltransferase [Vampirovibrio sp.]